PATVSADTADVARDVLKSKINASVELAGTIVAKASGDHADKLRVPKQQVATRGMIVDASGLAVCSLTKINPLAGGRTISARNGMTVKLRGEVTGLTMRLSSGTMVPARVVYTDAKKDLAFVAPLKALSADQKAAIAVVSLDATSADILDEIIVLARGNKATNYAPVCSLTRIASVVTRPTRYYLAGASVGSMVFTAQGKLLGLTVIKKTTGGVSASTGRASISAMPIIIPSAEIKALLPKAQQAAAKPIPAKPAAPKPAPKPAPVEPQGPGPDEV
ncbi:MAG: hypothetical protein HN909_01550, partial [Phycisphaerales bacterium]|nr:hypothetical protein [Phycisphaerales bacterium]